jgi:hypothetical protein
MTQAIGFFGPVHRVKKGLIYFDFEAENGVGRTVSKQFGRRMLIHAAATSRNREKPHDFGRM